MNYYIRLIVHLDTDKKHKGASVRLCRTLAPFILND